MSSVDWSARWRHGRMPARYLPQGFCLAPCGTELLGESFHVLIQRAARADSANPAITWIELADCDNRADTCPNAMALTRLTRQAPKNAVIWLLKIDQDLHDLRLQSARNDLARAASSSEYDDYAGASLKVLSWAVTRHQSLLTSSSHSAVHMAGQSADVAGLCTGRQSGTSDPVTGRVVMSA